MNRSVHGWKRWTQQVFVVDCSSARRKGLSNVIFDASEQKLEEVLDKHLDKTKRPATPEQSGNVLTTRREALSLYRSILRYSKLFVWTDDRGKPWVDVLRESARREFESARFESDPTMVAKMLVTGRDAVQQTVDKFMAKRQQLDEEALHGPGRAPGTPPYR